MHLLLASDPLDEVVSHTLFKLFGIVPVTNHMLMALVAFILMLLIFPRLFRTPQSDAPTGARNFFESILEFLRVEVVRPALKEHTDRFIPFLWTQFFFILFCNLLGIIPLAALIGLITGNKVEHIGGSPTGTVAVTAALAVCAFFFIHINGIYQVARSLMDGTYGHHAPHEEHTANGSRNHEAAQDLEHVRGEALAADVSGDFRALGNPTQHYNDDRHVGNGHRKADPAAHTGGKQMGVAGAALLAFPLYVWNFAPHPFKPAPGKSFVGWFADVPFFLFLLVLEIIGAAIKPFALCVRLFANMVAGRVLLAVLVSLIVLVPFGVMQLVMGVPLGGLDVAIQVLEIFVAFLQAYIFTFLTTLFIASAVAPEH